MTEKRRVSNYLAHKLLGEAGFLQQGQSILHEDKTVTNWQRHNTTLTLTEYKDAREPTLHRISDGVPFDFFLLGVRNTDVNPPESER